MHQAGDALQNAADGAAQRVDHDSAAPSSASVLRPPAAAAGPRVEYWELALLVGIVVLFAALRLRMLTVPLERDEGEYAYIAQQMLRGVPPYESGHILKLPGVPAIYAAAMVVLGETTEAIRAALIAFNSAAIVLVYFLGRRLTNRAVALLAAACYGLLSLDAVFSGVAAQSEQFVMPLVLASLLLASRGGSPFGIGLLIGLGVLCKQHAAAFAIIGFPLLIAPRGWGASVRFCVGLALPWSSVAAVMVGLGMFSSFWYWTVTRAAIYGATNDTTVSGALGELTRLGLAAPLVWALAALGLMRLLFGPQWRLVATMLAGGALGGLPGLNMFGHYFIYLLPLASICFGHGAYCVAEMINVQPVATIGAAIAGLLLAITSVPKLSYLFRMTPIEISRQTYGNNPFPEAIELADYIKAHGGGSVFVFGSEPELYFYLGQRSPSRCILAYLLVDGTAEASSLQREVAKEVAAAAPEWLVYVGVPASWCANPRMDQWFFAWNKEYTEANYELAGVVDIRSADWTEWRWGVRSVDFNQLSDQYLLVYRRKPAAKPQGES